MPTASTSWCAPHRERHRRKLPRACARRWRCSAVSRWPIQIWLQLLLHVFRLRERDVVVLDEPDVFLHPDLQRRLVRLLDSLPGQTITATHSSEVLVEAAPESVIWVDKWRRNSVSSPDETQLTDLTISL